MHDLTILLVGVIVGLALGVIVSAVRRTPVVGGPAPMAPEVRESRGAEAAAAASERAAAIEPILAADEGVAAEAEAIPPGAADLTVSPTGIPGETRLRYSKTFVKRRIETRVTPDGIAITVDGTTYHGIDEIPDPATRDQVRKTLEALPEQVTDPVLRAKVEGELEALGITPDPRA
jgi:hypothetical protein